MKFVISESKNYRTIRDEYGRLCGQVNVYRLISHESTPCYLFRKQKSGRFKWVMEWVDSVEEGEDRIRDQWESMTKREQSMATASLR